MLHGIEPETVNPCLQNVPFQPLFRFSPDLRISHIDIHTHQVIEITLFRISVRIPAFSGKTVDPVTGLAVFVPVCPCKMGMVPFETAVFPVSAVKVEL